jgi:hypothetical protein
VDLPEDGSNSTFDGRDGKIDESNGFSTGNMLQYVPSAASEVPPLPPRYTTDYGDSPVHKWHKELVNKGVHPYVFRAEIDCSAENILQYCTANIAMGAYLEQLIKQHIGAIRDNMESTFQTVFDKLDNLTRKVDKMALEEVPLCKAAEIKATYHMAMVTPPANTYTIWQRRPPPCICNNQH